MTDLITAPKPMKQTLNTVWGGARDLLLDDMSDGQWHPYSKIQQRNLANYKSGRDMKRDVNKHVERGDFLKGTGNSYRMTRDALEMWREERGLIHLPANNPQSPRYFGGILEDDGWLDAPLRSVDIVHFHSLGRASQEIYEVVGLEGMCVMDTDGMMRIFSVEGTRVYNKVKEWATTPGVTITGVRIDKNAQRRELCDLDPNYLAELCNFYGSFAHTLLRSSMTSVRKHISDPDDIQQQIYLWIIAAIQRYDADLCIPFAAYLHSSMSRWVHDLNRKSYGRAVADSELQISRAMKAFEMREHRRPSLHELAQEMGEDVEKVRHKQMGVANITGLRSASKIESEEFVTPLVATETATEDFESRVEAHQLSRVLTKTIRKDAAPDIASFLSIYNRHWGTGSRRETAKEQSILADMREQLATAA